jgi:predicted ArsR family transcriptional regulator
MAATNRPTELPLDRPLIDLLRTSESLSVADLMRLLGITGTAVRQRIQRAIKAGLVEQVAEPRRTPGRGRPQIVYRLTTAGRDTAGDNFRDLATVLWQEIREIQLPAVRRGLLGRIGRSLANHYAEDVQGDTARERLESVADMLRARGISCTVEAGSPERGEPLPVLTTHSCPYPDLAEQDRGICAAEQTMLQRLVGEPVKLADCRLDGGDCCRFSVNPAPGSTGNSATTMVQQQRQSSAVD